MLNTYTVTSQPREGEPVGSIDRDTERQTDRQTGRLAGKERKRKRERESVLKSMNIWVNLISCEIQRQPREGATPVCFHPSIF